MSEYYGRHLVNLCLGWAAFFIVALPGPSIYLFCLSCDNKFNFLKSYQVHVNVCNHIPLTGLPLRLKQTEIAYARAITRSGAQSMGM